MSLVLGCASDRRGRLPSLPDVVIPIDDLCTDPHPMVGPASQADGLVLLVHPEHLDMARIQAAIRKAGFDPFGVPLVDIAGAVGDPDRLRVMVAGATGRAAAFAGSRPEQARPVMPTAISRRALLTIPRPYYEPVPAVDHASCAADDGCRACIGRCPQEAYRLAGRKIAFDKDACVACGICVVACPTGAITHPAAASEAVRAEIDGIVASTSAPGIVFTCAQAQSPVTSRNWYGVTVPCSGMVPGTWLVAALLLGAAGATIRPCAEAGCPIAHDAAAAASVALARDLVVGAGLPAGLIPDALDAVPPPASAMVADLVEPFGVHGPAEVALALAARNPALSVEASASPLGVIDVDEGICTLCTMCAETCPTGALGHGVENDLMTLSFDPGLCTGCAQCLPMCPEYERGAITLHHRVDTAALARGRVVVRKSEALSCQSCGRPIAPAATLDRIAGLLGDEHAETARYLATRCMDCRGIA